MDGGQGSRFSFADQWQESDPEQQSLCKIGELLKAFCFSSDPALLASTFAMSSRYSQEYVHNIESEDPFSY